LAIRGPPRARGSFGCHKRDSWQSATRTTSKSATLLHSPYSSCPKPGLLPDFGYPHLFSEVPAKWQSCCDPLLEIGSSEVICAAAKASADALVNGEDLGLNPSLKFRVHGAGGKTVRYQGLFVPTVETQWLGLRNRCSMEIRGASSSQSRRHAVGPRISYQFNTSQSYQTAHSLNFPSGELPRNRPAGTALTPAAYVPGGKRPLGSLRRTRQLERQNWRPYHTAHGVLDATRYERCF
jgi:hypothetical protein